MSLKTTSFITITSWGVLGFYRGLHEYNYNHAKNPKKPYLYSEKTMNGIVGCLLYLNPFLLSLSVPNEIYRLEVNIRGFKTEKTTRRYNEIMYNKHE